MSVSVKPLNAIFRNLKKFSLFFPNHYLSHSSWTTTSPPITTFPDARPPKALHCCGDLTRRMTLLIVSLQKNKGGRVPRFPYSGISQCCENNSGPERKRNEGTKLRQTEEEEEEESGCVVQQAFVVLQEDPECLSTCVFP